jgi:hypothetical protein
MMSRVAVTAVVATLLAIILVTPTSAVTACRTPTAGRLATPAR